jgi:putative heme transporter
VVFAVVLGFGGLGAATFPMAAEQARALGKNAPDLVARVRAHPRVQKFDERYGLLTRAQKEVGEGASKIAGRALRVVASVLKVALELLAIAFLSIFILLYGGDLFRGLVDWVRPEARFQVEKVAGRIWERVAGYVSGRLLLSGLNGVVTGVLLWAVGMPYFLPLAFLMALISLLPYATTPATLLIALAVFADKGPKTALLVLGALSVFENLSHYVLHPFVMKRAIKLNPLSTVLSVLIGGAAFGWLGALVAPPIAAAAHEVLTEIKARRKARWRRQELPLWSDDDVTAHH